MSGSLTLTVIPAMKLPSTGEGELHTEFTSAVLMRPVFKNLTARIKLHTPQCRGLFNALYIFFRPMELFAKCLQSELVSHRAVAAEKWIDEE